MADTVESLQARIDALEVVYEQRLLKPIRTSFKYADQGTTYEAATLDDLRKYISRLQDKLDVLKRGHGRGPVFVVF